ncbi:MAG: hypothetical protein DLM69_11825 [Candidatus Chloroheliales bacterium]|nr:MAG: hypothetical protein DLM69_11825 [Chloroflexota bacterium]
MISERDEQQARLLEEYCQALMTDPSSPPPAGLEAELARVSQQLRQQMRAPLPSAHFAAALQAQLEAESAAPVATSEAEVLSTPKPAPRPVRIVRSTVSWLAAAALIVLAVAGALYVASDLASHAERQSLPVQPEAHTAAEIIARAKAMYQSDAIKSFELTQVFTPTGQATPWKSQHIFYQTPSRTRIENSDSTIVIDDGTNVWNFAPPRTSNYGGEVTVNGHDATWQDRSNGTTPNYIQQLNYDIYKLPDCYQPTLVGNAVVAGRPTYVLDMDSPVDTPCARITPVSLFGRHLLWIDHDSYFVLKSIPYKSNKPNDVISEVTNVHYNLPLATNLFNFVIPKGVTVDDYRPMNTASDDQFRAQAAEELGVISFTTYLPGYLPDKLQADNLQYNAEAGMLSIYYRKRLQSYPSPSWDYSIPGEYGITTTKLVSLRLTMWQATPDQVASETKNLHKVVISGEDVWVGCSTLVGTSDCIGGWQEVAVIRGDTLIGFTSSGISVGDLTKVAASLTPLPSAPAKGPAFPTMPPAPTQPPLPTAPDGTMP